MKQQHCDVVIIGAGIIGAMVARELSRYRLSITVLEREPDVGMGQSTANSAIIHSGHDPEPGTLKACLNVHGNELWRGIASELDIPLDETGALIVAMSDEEAGRLTALRERGVTNGVPGIEIIDGETARVKEPALSTEAVAALWTPTAAVVDPFQGVLGAAENAAANGVDFVFGAEVVAIGRRESEIDVRTADGSVYTARWVINAAGVHSDDMLHLAGDHPEFQITARRGEYFVFDPAAVQARTVLFPMPGPAGKGILVTATTHGNTMAGPNSERIDDKEDDSVTAEGLHAVLDGARRLVPAIEPKAVIATFAGLRATGNWIPPGASVRDFLIEHSSVLPGLISLAGIESPGYASAPAIAEYVVTMMRAEGEPLRERADWDGRRVRIPRFADLAHAERAERIADDPAWGRIVCRCEEVTEAEVVAAIRSPIPAVTYDAIKRRTWLGTGRCQGSFDYPRTMQILARELMIPMTEVTKQGPGSVFLYRRTKDEVI